MRISGSAMSLGLGRSRQLDAVSAGLLPPLLAREFLAPGLVEHAHQMESAGSGLADTLPPLCGLQETRQRRIFVRWLYNPFPKKSVRACRLGAIVIMPSTIFPISLSPA